MFFYLVAASIVQILRQRGCEITDFNHEDLLLYSAKRGYFDIIKLIVPYSKSQDTRDTCKIPIKRVKEALLIACSNKHLDIVNYLLTQYNSGITMNSALFLAITQDNLSAASFLCENGADVNSQNSEGSSVLRVICERYRFKLVGELLTSTSTDSNTTTAIANGHNSDLSMLELVLKQGADTNVYYTDTGYTILLDTIQWICLYKPTLIGINMITILLQYGCDINKGQNYSGETALHIATSHRHIQLIKILSAYGADVSRKNRANMSVLGILKEGGKEVENSEILRLLSEDVTGV